MNESPQPTAEQPGTPGLSTTPRRLLWLLLALLGAAAVGLGVLIVFLLRPSEAPTSSTILQSAGCPMTIERSIYGIGTDPGDLLLRPMGVALDPDGNVWVADTGHARLLEFDATGTFIREAGEGRLTSPYGLAFDETGSRLYVADWNAHQVLVFSGDGRYIESYPAPDQDLSVFGPVGFTPFEVRAWGAFIVVSSNDGLYFFDRDGKVVDYWGTGTRSREVGGFNFPDAFDIDPELGRFYVADTLNRRVVALDETGNVLWVSGQPDEQGKIVGFWELPRSVAVGPDGNVYVVDTFRFQNECAGTGHIVVLSPEGDLIGEFGAGGPGEDTFNFPEKLAIASNGVFAIADRENGRIALFRLDGLPRVDESETKLYAKSFVRFGGVGP
ncbi:serine/threonine-protein kinase PknD [bacterium BMS3Abin02]|nr:serine/threonine-protein kinase PknD [bacterium BMS3Abin02]